MPRFFLDFQIGGRTIADEEGFELRNHEEAEQEVVRMLCDMTADDWECGPRRISAAVRDADNVLIYRATVAFEAERLSGRAGADR